MNTKVLLGVIAGLLAAVLVAVIVVANVLVRQEEQRVYEACMARSGIDFDSPPPGDDADAYIERAAAAAERCLD